MGQVQFGTGNNATVPDQTKVEVEDQGSSVLRQVVKSAGSQNFATTQVTLATSATLILAARANRIAVTIETLGTSASYIGGVTVTTSTGVPLLAVAGASITIPTQAAVYGVVGSGTQVVGAFETY